MFDNLVSVAAAASPLAISAGPSPAGLPQIQNLFIRIINISVPLAFVAMTVMLVYAGVMYIVSGGETKSIQQASGIMTWALMGIVFLVLAWLILLLIQAFTGVQVTQFNLSFPTPAPGGK